MGLGELSAPAGAAGHPWGKPLNFPTLPGWVNTANEWLTGGGGPTPQPTPAPYVSPSAGDALANQAASRSAAAAYGNQFRGNLDFYSTYSAPQMSAYDAMAGRAQGEIGGVLANQSIQADMLNGNYDLARQKLALQQQGLGVDRNAAGRQVGNANALEALANQLYGNQMAGYGLDKTQAWQGADQSGRAANSSATARGAMNAPGIGRSQTDIANHLAGQLQQIGLGEQRAKIGLDQTKVGLAEQRASAGDRQRSIDLMAKGLGLDGKQLQNQLKAGLSNLGLDTLVKSNDLFDAMNGTDIQRQQLAIQILNQALSSTGLGLDMGAMYPQFGGQGVTARPVATDNTYGKFGR